MKRGRFFKPPRFFIAKYALPANIFFLVQPEVKNMEQAAMRRKVELIFILGSIGLWAASCQGPSRRPLVGEAVLPPDIAGTWKAQDSDWKIVLSPDGTLSSAVIPMGVVEVRPNQTTKTEMKDGSYSTFKTGDCVVEYTPATRELFVSVQMEEIHIVFLDNVIDGNSIDRFIGPVSEDGKVWTADWITVFDYGPRFPQDVNDTFGGQLIFEKIEQ